jgi:E3 ubiquitin-protein ligase UBR7
MEGVPSDHANIKEHENGALDHMGGEKTSMENGFPQAMVVPEKANFGDSSGNNCKLGTVVNTMPSVTEKNMPFFMSKGWRDTLCRCETCTNFYAQRGIAYLVDKEDSIEEYEKIAKQKREKKLEQQEGAETNFLNSLNHVQKIEILSGINDMKNEFQSFLESFDSSKPVTSEDIRSVFENLAKKKKQRLS